MSENTRLYSIKEVMEKTSLGRSTIYGEMASGRLRSVTVGRRRLFTAGALADYINRLAEVGELNSSASASQSTHVTQEPGAASSTLVERQTAIHSKFNPVGGSE